MKREDAIRLYHMLDAAQEAREFMGCIALQEFIGNRLLGNAVVHSLMVIGEAAAQLSDDLKRAHPEIEWAVIVGMRNRLVHAYFDTNYETVWRTVNEDLPVLIEQLTVLLETG